ncbi:hypothetical protein [Nannocystis punicea]|uniref:Uncharacterized protein n=1 Tax=Nannocystis punicea TaxID=2995304 RepID=A0ABY7H6D7_9BACT|nr:hypothetical protein [Nannocystis poenicansa]WAS94851.1 hypothetical protein O0S08_01710 [Nannocystis poenicansa]
MTATIPRSTAARLQDDAPRRSPHAGDVSTSARAESPAHHSVARVDSAQEVKTP